MGQYKVKFQLKDANGHATGRVVDEIIQAPDPFTAKDLVDRKYGGVQMWGAPTELPQQTSNQRSQSSPNTSTPSNPAAGGCLAIVGALAFIIASALGLIKPEQSNQNSSSTEVQQQSDAEQQPVDSQSTTSEAAPVQSPQQLWGAVSTNASNQTWRSTNYPSEEEAKAAALEACGDSSCKIVATFGRGSAAVVESDSKWYVQAGRNSEGEASAAAMSECQSLEPAGNCRISSTFSF